MREAQGQDASGVPPLKTCGLVTSPKLWPVFIAVMLLFLSTSACKGDHILALLPSDIGGMATLSLYFTASLATPPGNSSPKRDNQVISLRDRLHEPPCSANQCRPLSHSLLCELVLPPAAQRDCLPHDNEITATSTDQGFQWDLRLPGWRADL